MSSSAPPRIELFPHADCDGLPLERLREQVFSALPLCLDSCGTGPPLLGGLEEVEISLVSDDAIAVVHGEFMDDPSPTDVITFHHGEILVSLDTARREASFHGNSVAEEVLLYIIHGLLHLNGHADEAEPDRSAMHLEQEKILRKIVSKGSQAEEKTLN